jgi:hypothetical protein
MKVQVINSPERIRKPVRKVAPTHRKTRGFAVTHAR